MLRRRNKPTKAQKTALADALADTHDFPKTLYVRRRVTNDYEDEIDIDYPTYKTAARAIDATARERETPDDPTFFAEYELKKISRAKLEVVVEDDDI